MIVPVILVIFTPFLWWYLTLWKYKPLNNIPGPKPLPFIGNSWDLGNTPQALFKNLFELSKKYGKVFKIYVPNEMKVLVSKAELTEKILSSNEHITKSHTYDFILPWLGRGLLISTGKKWKSRRKMITPTFHFKILDQFLDIFNSAGTILIEKLSKKVGDEYVDIFFYVNLYSLDVICETSLGAKVNTQEQNNTEYVGAVRGFLDIFIVRIFSTWERFDLLFRLFSNKFGLYKYYLDVLHKFSNNIISQRRVEKSKEHKQLATSDDGIKRKVALLDMLLESESNSKLTNEDIREEIDTFIFEGHDTTTSGISFAILALADNLQVQEKVYQEIVSVIGTDQNEYITMQHLQDMKYLDMVIKEVQRVYPSVPMIERELQKDANIDGYDFPKGTTLAIYTYALHHCEDNFPEPNKFDPDRFLPENQAKRHNFAYVPFSAGPRNCIGQKFAVLEMKSCVIKIVRKFKILPVSNYKPDLGMAAILKSYNGVRVQLKFRSEE